MGRFLNFNNDRASGNWYPYNTEGSQHDGRNQAQTRTGTQKKIVDKPLSLEERLFFYKELPWIHKSETGQSTG